MRKLLAGLMLLGLSIPAFASNRAIMEGIAASHNTVWVDTTNVRVGIGTIVPTSTLSVVGRADFNTIQISSATGTFIKLSNTAAGDTWFVNGNTQPGLSIGYSENVGPHLNLSRSQPFVGINTVAPATNLDVNGNFQWGSGVNKSSGDSSGNFTTAPGARIAGAATTGDALTITGQRISVGGSIAIQTYNAAFNAFANRMVFNGGADAGNSSISVKESIQNDATAASYFNGALNVGTQQTNQSTILNVEGSAQFGAGVNKSTFTLNPGGTSFALNLSTGLALATGCIQFPSGAKQCNAAGNGSGDVLQSGNNVFSGTNQFGSSVVAVGFTSGFAAFQSTQSFAGDQTIAATASPGTAISGSTFTMVTQVGSTVTYCATIVTDGNSGEYHNFEFYVDSVAQGRGSVGSYSMRFTSAGNLETAAPCWNSQGLTAGSHTFFMQAWAISGSGAFAIKKLNPPMYINVRENRR